MDGITANAADDGTSPRAGEPTGKAGVRMGAGLTPSICAGIIVLVALLVLIAIRFGFAGALGD